MLLPKTIVISALLALGAPLLNGCGQKGDLYLPTEPEAAQRATLPQTLIPGLRRTAPASAPAAGAPSRPAESVPVDAARRP